MEITDNLEKYDVKTKSNSIRLFYKRLRFFQGKLQMYNSPLGNNRYRLMPFGIYRKPVCKMLNNEYRNIIMRDVHKYTNMPFSEDRNVNLCDLMPVVHLCILTRLSWIMPHFFFRDTTILDRSVLITYTPLGRYKFQLLLFKKTENRVVKLVEMQALFT